MSGITLEQINQETEDRYGPFVVEDVPGGEVHLRNALRLAKNERHQLIEMQARITGLDASSLDSVDRALDVLTSFIDLVSVGDGGKRLIKAVDSDPGKMMYIIEQYAKATQLGEALRSAS